jgi:hypothetical protein
VYLIIEEMLGEASSHWCRFRRRCLNESITYGASLALLTKIGSVWHTDEGWLNRVENDQKYNALAEEISSNGWNVNKPVLIGLASNGFVSLLDGNHRLVLVLRRKLLQNEDIVPAKIYYFDVGMPINPMANSRVWTGSNLGFLCFPTGTCGKCSVCLRTKPIIRKMLECGSS